jgi:hypothetical protein
MTKLWWAQIKAVIRLEMKKTFFARRGLWIYILALLPLLLFTAHTVFTSRDREKSRQIARQRGNRQYVFIGTTDGQFGLRARSPAPAAPAHR